MLNIKNESKIIKKIKNCLIKITNYLENNNNCNFKTNGEEKFINDFFSIYRNSKMIISSFLLNGNSVYQGVGKYPYHTNGKCTYRRDGKSA